ncbi:LysR family transcriptional regulator [Rhodococcus sp. PAMC28707]|uniref:LysR family transcriptional regulator n=1 Tax=unclassified Rhodococcus (in: high G+C Gram-positive bacteria) TaxID=192944 RepID=UPI00109DEDBD|nr:MULTISPECIES: LysR family transcriptional regulator [unclassified Rhodococcus (in: high G+C Gram-positive bacteria)]QCB51737.1 LysR family transcriptional regulator [Rhodococcus sp. PAMC28705]QCB60095.1 LysR family transcriptional regulator [Rhodococcus sp. PAMC28707]
MIDISMRELRYVAVLDRELNFTRAAAAIPMAQPALSQAIARMERRLGVQLFRRTSRLVQPTAAGSLLAERARAILQDTALAVLDAQILGGTAKLRMYVAEPSLQLPRLVLGAIRAEVPIPVHQTSVPWNEVSDQLRTGELAMALGPEVNGQGLVSELLREETVVVVMDQSHPLANRQILTIAMLAQHPTVSIDRTMSSWDMTVERMFERADYTPWWTESTAFGAVAAADLVADGVSTLLALESITADQPQGRVCRPLSIPWTEGWFLSYRAASQELPAVAAAAAAARSVLGADVYS